MKNAYWFVAALACAGVMSGCPDRGAPVPGEDAGPEEDGGGDEEQCDDRVDNDGDDLVDEVPPCQVGPVDEDGDGFAAPPEGEECDEDDDECDCDDDNVRVNPGAEEICTDHIGDPDSWVDEDCDGDANEHDSDCEACEEDSDCADDEFCVDDECVECRRNSDCDDDETCVRDRCVPEGIDFECLEDRDCDPDEACRDFACIQVACNEDSDCDDDIMCTLDECIDDECVHRARNSRCDENEVCDPDDPDADEDTGCVSEEECQNDDDCGRREICDNGDCVDVECTEDDDCSDSVDCTLDRCVRNECEFEPDDDECGASRPFCELDEGCVECLDDSDCEDGLFCTVSERCFAGECATSARDCGDGNANTADSCNEATDQCDHVAQNVEVCDGADNDGDGVRDDGFACVLNTSEACQTGCGSTGTRTCQAGCVWGACTPPAESCNARDDDCDGAVDENDVCGECGGETNTVYVQASSGRVGDHLLWSDLEGEDRFCEAGWNSSSDGTAPYEWTFEGTDGLHTINVQGPDGRYYVYIPNGNAGGACATRDGWATTVRINGVDRVVAAFDLNRKSIEANSCVLDHEEGGWCNVICCLGGSACELDCDDGLDNDGNGGIDCADADCDLNRVYRPAGLCP